jgi:hypothetical protein
MKPTVDAHPHDLHPGLDAEMDALRAAYREPRILRNRARCTLCGDVVESRHRHDFRSCGCGAVAVDGGRAYLRRCGEPANLEEMSEFAPEDNSKEPNGRPIS